MRSRWLAMRALFIGFLYLIGQLGTAVAAGRVALIIGNSAYTHTAALSNPKNDAADIADALKKRGFQVIEGFDLDKAAFDRKVRDFATALSGAEVGMFFYAGHGLQVAGQNYLVPIDAELSTAAALEFETVRLDLIQRIMEGQASTNILFLDACRNNPLTRNLARALGTRSAGIGRGLAATESGVGTLISFSTQPGNVALDGAGRNSPFAGALAPHLSQSNDDLSAILIDVRNNVMKDTQRKQVPWEHSALTRRFYLDGSTQQERPAHAEPVRGREGAEEWDRVKDTTNTALLESFITRFKDTFFAELARARLDELKNHRSNAQPQSQPAAPMQSAWVKLCTNTSEHTCTTHHEKFNANNGEVLVNIGIRRVEGQRTETLTATVTSDVLQQHGVRIGFASKDAWDQIEKTKRTDWEKLKALNIPFTNCEKTTCTAEIEATPALINDLKTSEGLVVAAITSAGKAIGMPVSLIGFTKAYEGSPVDSVKFHERRKAFLDRIKSQR